MSREYILIFMTIVVAILWEIFKNLFYKKYQHTYVCSLFNKYLVPLRELCAPLQL